MEKRTRHSTLDWGLSLVRETGKQMIEGLTLGCIMRTKVIESMPSAASANSLVPTILERSCSTQTRSRRMTALNIYQLVYSAVVLCLTFDGGEVKLSRWVKVV